MFRGESVLGFFIAIFGYFLAPLVGFVLRIIALVRVHKHSELKGKWFAIVAIAIPVVLLLILVFIG